MSNTTKTYKRFTETQLEGLIRECQRAELEHNAKAQVTNQGDVLIRVMYYDTSNDAYSNPFWIQKGKLSRYYSEGRILPAINGTPVISITHLDLKA